MDISWKKAGIIGLSKSRQWVNIGIEGKWYIVNLDELGEVAEGKKRWATVYQVPPKEGEF